MTAFTLSPICNLLLESTSFCFPINLQVFPLSSFLTAFTFNCQSLIVYCTFSKCTFAVSLPFLSIVAIGTVHSWHSGFCQSCDSLASLYKLRNFQVAFLHFALLSLAATCSCVSCLLVCLCVSFRRQSSSSVNCTNSCGITVCIGLSWNFNVGDNVHPSLSLPSPPFW